MELERSASRKRLSLARYLYAFILVVVRPKHSIPPARSAVACRCTIGLAGELPLHSPTEARSFNHASSPLGGCGAFMQRRRRASLPLHAQLSIRLRAVAQVQIDEILIRDAVLFRQRPKIVDGVLIATDRKLLLRLAQVGILDGFREVVVFLQSQPPAVLTLLDPWCRHRKYAVVTYPVADLKQDRHESIRLPWRPVALIPDRTTAPRPRARR